MVTRNFKNISIDMLAAAADSNASATTPADRSVAYSPLFDVKGVPIYMLSHLNGFPYAIYNDFTLDPNESGISFGTDGTPATEDDINLKNTITKDITVTISSITSRIDENEAIIKSYVFLVMNKGSAPLTIREIGYKQRIYASRFPKSQNTYDYFRILLDRTVLDTPVTINSNEAGVIGYSLISRPTEKYVNGVKIVSWTHGSDDDVAAMIDAARAGTIDLERDAGWRVGDLRPVQIGSFTGAGDREYEAQTVDIAIAQFGDYNSCGAIMQFDFWTTIGASSQRLNVNQTNVGGYSHSDAYLTTLPALVDALPEWLRSRLKIFNVFVSEGNQSLEIETVPGNQLALRSEVEMTGALTRSAPGEGSIIDLYKKCPTYKYNRANNSTYSYFLRSPDINNTISYVCATYPTGVMSTTPANTYGALAPFGCL